MSCLINKETLADFRNNYIIPSLKSQNTGVSLVCVQRCQEIISIYRTAFPCDCAQLDLLLILIKQHLIDIRHCLVAMEEVAQYMYDHFDEIYKAPKVFISHSTDDRPIVEKFVTMNRSMLVELIDSIYVYQAEGTGRNHKQKVEINYRFLAGSQCSIA